jgi:hypothetical protein
MPQTLCWRKQGHALVEFSDVYVAASAAGMGAPSMRSLSAYLLRRNG